MAFNLLNSVQSLFNNETISNTAAALGENESSIQKALSGAVPSVLSGILEKASGSDGIASIIALAKQALSSGILSNISSFSGGQTSLSGLAANLFGDKTSVIESLLAGFSGIKTSSASTLLNTVAPAALGVLGNHVSENHISGSGLTSFLASQKDSILSAIPSGFNLAGALGLGSLSGIGSQLSAAFSGTHDTHTNATHVSHDDTRKPNWLTPAFFAIAVFVVVLYLFKSCLAVHPEDNAHKEPATEHHAAAEEKPLPAEPVRESLKVKLPDGTELDAYKGGIEDMLVAYLNSNEPISKEKWFDFDDLNFETGSATITSASLKQVQNIAAILKAFPKVNIKIGGYTDNTGDSLSNVKLSQSRADAVSNKLKELGSTKQLEGAEGYGPTHFVAPNDTEENKKKNRRISINVRAK
ncbi:MAG: OmpA family protein [Agriterribacter sp.]